MQAGFIDDKNWNPEHTRSSQNFVNHRNPQGASLFYSDQPADQPTSVNQQQDAGDSPNVGVAEINHSDVLGDCSRGSNNATSDGKAVSGPCSDGGEEVDGDYFNYDDSTMKGLGMVFDSKNSQFADNPFSDNKKRLMLSCMSTDQVARSQTAKF